MGTYTFLPTANSGAGSAFDTGGSYTKAREGTGSVGVGTAQASATCGQYRSGSIYQTNEGYFEFDTSSLAGKTIVSATLSIYPTTLSNAASFTCEARLYDYGTSLTNADYVAGSAMAAKTLLATLADTAATTGAYRAFTNVAFPANINTAGKTRIGIFSSEQRLNSAPGNGVNEWVTYDGDIGTNPPKLVVVTADEGQLVATLGAFTLSSAIAIETFGATNANLGDFTISAAGVLTSAGSGLLDQALGDFTLSATIGIETFGYVDLTLDNFTLSTVALLPLNGDLAATLDNFTLSSVVARDTTGQLSVTLDPFTLQTSNSVGITGDLAATLGPFVLTASQSSAPWPSIYGFPQKPLDGTWDLLLGDDTLRSERADGARQARARYGGNHATVAFTIQLENVQQRQELDRFFRDDCKNGSLPFHWPDPVSGAIAKWTWSAPPLSRHHNGEIYRVECALRREAA